VVLAVAHKEFAAIDIDNLKNENSVVYDIKGALEKGKADKRL
jgi:UDP-N-acetyl-D-galactosamine dehydrogenase